MAVQAQQHYPENLGFSLCGSQEWMDVNGGFYELSLCLHQQQQQQQMLQLQNQQRYQNPVSQNSQVFSPSNDNRLTIALSQSLAAQLEKQRQEIDQLILSQNERLRSALQEQRKQQVSNLLRKIESKTLSLLQQRDEEIAKANKKKMELEEWLRRVEMENQAWQRVAKENEAMVIALNNKLEQVKENVCLFASVAEDAESCCDLSHWFNKGDKMEEEAEEEEERKKMACKRCNSRRSCVLFLPCRHLCSCKSCEAFLDSCPVCKSIKKASMEVYMF